MRISEAFNLYLEDYIRFKNQSTRIEESHEFCERTLIYEIGDKQIEELTLADIRRWRNELSKTRHINTVRNYITRLRAVLNYCSIRGVQCLDVRLVPIPKREATVPTFLSSEQVDAMISHAYNVRNAFIVSLIYSSGIRLSELIALNRGQIQHRRFTVIGKGSKPRLCFIDERTENLMDQYFATREDHESALVVSYESKHRMTATNIQLLIRNSAKRAGIKDKVTPHTLRHSFATNFLQNNGNMRYLAELLGHASLETTQMYAHVVNNDLQSAYEKYHTI
jgi:integrase/recombinase XerD